MNGSQIYNPKPRGLARSPGRWTLHTPRRGVTATEFALVLPILLLLVFVGIGVGLGYGWWLARQPTVAPSPIPAEVIITNRPSMSSGR